jgi:4-amino-4-deoxy-L-arabinose transferase-like glycosyltransferase
VPEAEPVVAAPTRPDDQPVSGRFRVGDGARNAIALTIIGLMFAIPLRGLLRSPGPPMEEGFMLVFPEQVLKGAIPNRDFLHLYGPGSLWALAGVFKVFGVSLWSERGFGLLQQLAIVFGVYALARRWGRILAVSAALTSGLIIIPFGLTALAWVGGVGLAVCGLAAGIEARACGDGDPKAKRWALTAGLLLGFAVLFRLDLVLGVGLAGFALIRGMERTGVKRLFVGFGLGVAPYAIHIATAGPGHVFQGMLIDPIFRLRGGRSLPIPPSWGHLDGFLQRAGALAQLPSTVIPLLPRSHELFLWFFMLLGGIAFVLWQGWRATRADPSSITARTLFVMGLFGLGILPQALQRVDSGHFSWVSCVVFAFVPIALYELMHRAAPRVRTRRLALSSGAFIMAVLVFVIPAFTVRTYANFAQQTFGIHRESYKIEHDGRVFYYGKADRAAAANMVIAAAARISKPGQRLFVGPVNLRKTPYSDAYLYYMLPDLVPATYYIEMDPGIANADNSRMPQDLASADVVILSAIWDNWSEPNDSRKVGSDASTQVLARDFCHVGTYLGLYQLYRKCH